MSIGRHMMERWAMSSYTQEMIEKATDEVEQKWWNAVLEKLTENNLHVLRMFMTNTLKVGCEFEPNTTDRVLYKKLYKQIVGYDFTFDDELNGNYSSDDDNEEDDEEDDEEEEVSEEISEMLKELDVVIAQEDAKCA